MRVRLRRKHLGRGALLARTRHMFRDLLVELRDSLVFEDGDRNLPRRFAPRVVEPLYEEDGLGIELPTAVVGKPTCKDPIDREHLSK